MGKRQRLTISITGILLFLCSYLQADALKGEPDTNRTHPVGTAADISYARVLWQELVAARLVGAQAMPVQPFIGAAPPHGWVLELLHQTISVADHSGFVVVKRNYDKKGLTVAQVAANRKKYLSSITVMYQREDGYDQQNQNWFWVKYRPDGSLFSKDIHGRTVSLAGRIVKGKTSADNGGCIYCHRSAGGGDYIFYPQVKKP
jgi:hypothetical protein